MSTSGRRLLVITYYFPPNPAVGGHRWHAMSRWLRRLGHDVTVLTTRAFGGLPDDAPWTERSFDLTGASPLRRLLRRHSLPAGRAPQPTEKATPAILTEVLVPDALVLGWLPMAALAARRLVRDRRIDCVITSGPPHSTHLAALALGRNRPAWIADFRDGWRFEPLRGPWPTRAQETLDARLERAVASRADALIGVTRPIAEDFADRLGVESAYISNGWDPDLDLMVAEASFPALDPDTVSIVHTGKLSGHRGRDPSVLLAAVGRVLAHRPDAADRLRIVLAGRLDDEEDRLLSELDLGDVIRHVGQLPREGALALQRHADALLLLTSPGHMSQATGKVFEYLTAGRPIIALADGNEAARLVRETGTGITLPTDDVEGLAEALEAALDGELTRFFAPRNLGPYVYPGPAEAVAELVERATALRASAR